MNLDDRSDQLTSSRQADQEAAQHLDQPFNVYRPGFTKYAVSLALSFPCLAASSYVETLC